MFPSPLVSWCLKNYHPKLKIRGALIFLVPLVITPLIGQFLIVEPLLVLCHIYEKLGLPTSQPPKMMLAFADKSIKHPKGVIEDVLIKIEHCYFPIDFTVLETDPSSTYNKNVPLILEKPFLRTSKCQLDFDMGLASFLFGNLTMNIHVFQCNGESINYKASITLKKIIWKMT